MKRIVLFGAPGAGKGSVASLLSARLSFPTISTGDLVRAEIRGQTEIGRKVQEITARGELVPDPVIIGMLDNGLNLLGAPFYLQNEVRGLVMIAAVSLAVLRSEIRFF